MYIGIDLGGTNIAVGLVDENGSLMHKDSVPTLRGRDYREIVKDMAMLAKKVTLGAGYTLNDVKGVGIGCPGTVDNSRGMVVYVSNLKMDHADIRGEFQKYIDIPVNLENDANAAAYGEYVASGKKTNSFVLVTLGTGVGGGIITDGKIYRGFNGAGGEIGHMAIKIGGERCGCGRRGCFEAYASVTALIRQTEEMIERCPESKMAQWVKEHGKVSGRTAFDCAKQGDKAAKEVKEQYIKYVAEGVANIINIFQPELLMIGGGISAEGDNLLLPLREYVQKNDYNRFMPKTVVDIARLKNDAGIVGAAMSAMQ